MTKVEAYNLQKGKENKYSSNTYTPQLNGYFANYIIHKHQEQIQNSIAEEITKAIEKSINI